MDKKTIKKIKGYYKQGLSGHNIAKKLKLSSTTVYRHLTLLTANKVLERVAQCKELNNQGLSINQIAQQLRVTRRTVVNILKKEGLCPPFSAKYTLEKVNSKEARCSRCSGVKTLDCFYKSYSFCKACFTKQRKAKLSKNIESFLQFRLRDLRKKSKKKKIPFLIVTKDLVGKFYTQEGKCYYTNEVLIWGKGPVSKHWLTVDKVVPELGYTENNIVLCTYQANVVKNNLNLEEMEKWLPSWYQKIQVLPQFEMLKEASDKCN